MTFALGLSSCTAVGHSMLQHDIAPQHAGVMFAVGNMVATGKICFTNKVDFIIQKKINLSKQ